MSINNTKSHFLLTTKGFMKIRKIGSDTWASILCSSWYLECCSKEIQEIKDTSWFQNHISNFIPDSNLFLHLLGYITVQVPARADKTFCIILLRWPRPPWGWTSFSGWISLPMTPTPRADQKSRVTSRWVTPLQHLLPFPGPSVVPQSPLVYLFMHIY